MRGGEGNWCPAISDLSRRDGNEDDGLRRHSN